MVTRDPLRPNKTVQQPTPCVPNHKRTHGTTSTLNITKIPRAYGMGGRHAVAGLVGVGLLQLVGPTSAQETKLLYNNDFESPNVEPIFDCGPSLDQREINILYGREGFNFAQQFTVETLHIDSLSPTTGQPQYRNRTERNGAYAIGMLSDNEEDRLALTFNTEGRTYLNVGFDLSAIDVAGCGTYGVGTPEMHLTLLDTPGGTFEWETSYDVLDEDVAIGTESTTRFAFQWKTMQIALDASESEDGQVTLVFDLEGSGYGTFDNLTVAASTMEGVVDRDLDEVTDDVDPEPDDPDVCGDADNDGEDDCTPDDVEVDGTGGGSNSDTGTGGSAEDTGVDNGEDEGESSGGGDGGCGCSVANDNGRSARSLGLTIMGALGVLAVRSRRRKR